MDPSVALLRSVHKSAYRRDFPACAAMDTLNTLLVLTHSLNKYLFINFYVYPHGKHCGCVV